MQKLNIKIGQKFDKLKVLKIKSQQYIICKCKCGNISHHKAYNLFHQKTRSCGCLHKKHGMSDIQNNRLYRIWTAMKRRCYNKNDYKFKFYGGREINVCKSWKDDFLKFYKWAMKNGYKDTLTINRKNNDGNYHPNNCNWITFAEQNKNCSRNIWITIWGERKIISEWSKDERCKVHINTLYKRIKNKINPKIALSQRTI